MSAYCRSVDIPARANRLFADDYSSTGQLEWKLGLRGASVRTWNKDFLGQLRFDSLTSETLVVPDSHLFDGLFFLHTGPEELLGLLGRGFSVDPTETNVLPIEIRSRRSTLADSLTHLLRREDSDHLNHYVFKTIEDPILREGVARELGRTHADQLDRALASSSDPAEAVISLLRRCLDRLGARDRVDEVLGPIERGWRRWLELESRIRVEPWARGRSFPLAAALAEEPLPQSQLSTAAGHEAQRLALLRVERGSLYRGDISRDLTGVKEQAIADKNSEGIAEAELVERWYSRGRYRAIAWQHECACVQVDRPWLEPLSGLQALYRELLAQPDAERVALPEGVITALGDLPADEFRRLTYEHRRDLLAWWHEGQLDGLHRTSERLAGLVQLDPERRNPVGLSELIGAAGPVGGAAAGGAIGGPFGAAVGALVGSAATLTAGRLRTPSEREKLRSRVLEAWVGRSGALAGSAQ